MIHVSLFSKFIRYILKWNATDKLVLGDVAFLR